MNMPDYRSASIFRKLGIAPELVAIVVPVDFILFSGEIISTVMSPLITIPVGLAVGIFSYLWQRRKYGDSRFRACAKGILLAVLTSVPTPLSSIFTFVGGILPLFDKTEPQDSKQLENDARRGKGKDGDTPRGRA